MFGCVAFSAMVVWEWGLGLDADDCYLVELVRCYCCFEACCSMAKLVFCQRAKRFDEHF
jgi:hypothetical protein